MQTQQIIQSSANVIRIVSLSKGNIYKRFDDSYTYYGIVTGVYNDGVNAIIESNEYRKTWTTIEATKNVLKGTKEVAIFPATIDELELEFSSAIDSLKRDIEGAKKTIAEKQSTIDFTEKLISGELQKELSTPDFKEITQQQFNETVAQIG